MTVFAVVYFGTALAVTAAVYFMSLNSEKKPALKTVLLIVYILALAGLVFATGCLEAKYGFTRLKSTAIAVLILLMIYLADTFGSKRQRRTNEGFISRLRFLRFHKNHREGGTLPVLSYKFAAQQSV